jgi:hypothetical protein
MVVKFDTPTKTSAGTLNNTGSSSAYVNYLGKEDVINQEREGKAEEWFSHNKEEVHPAAVRADIDKDHQGVGKDEGKFATGSVNPTEKEWESLGKTEKERHENFKKWLQEDFSKEFAGNFNKKDKAGNSIPIEPENVKMYYKVEHDRYYTGKDEAVQKGDHKQGERKEDFNVHAHFIVARKTEDGKNRISPTTNNRKEFDRNNLIHKTEQSFDRVSGYDRPLKESYDYMKTMKNGTGKEKAEMIQRANADELKREKPEHFRTKDMEQKIENNQERNINHSQNKNLSNKNTNELSL